MIEVTHVVSDGDLESLRAEFEQHGQKQSLQGVRDEKVSSARWIVEAVRKQRDAAVAECTAKFDGVQLAPEAFELGPEEIAAAEAAIDPALRAVIQRAHDNIRRFHSRHLAESWEESDEDGTVLGQRITPLDRVGVYVPGGKAFYPSSVLMNIAPARVAGVREIVMVSPPSYKGSIHPVVLYAAQVAGATRIFRIGGAQSIAALAFGTERIPPVVKITGPGNAYVTAAKAMVRGTVEIDSEAGPSEVVVLADETAKPSYVAAELLAQAEHDEDATSMLITPSGELAEAARQVLDQEVPRLPRKAIIAASLTRNARLVATRSMDEAIELTNILAPEHLSIQTEFPRRVAAQVRNAGAIMLGHATPVAVGDYFAGPNHILPTGRRARFASPLTAADFQKVTSIVQYSEARLRRDADDIIRFARAEDLQAHARSIEVRQ